MTAWVVRGGSRGEHEAWNLENNVATVGWEVGDLGPCKSRDEVRALVDEAYSGEKRMRNVNHAGQLWAFRNSIRPGDLVIMPLKTRSGYLAMGWCTGEYSYDPQGQEGRRHTLPVQWQPEPVAKTVIKDDLLFTLNAIQTVFSPSRHNAAERLEAVARTGVDPGRMGSAAPASKTQATTPPPVDQEMEDAADVVDPETAPTLEAIQDRIRTHLVENVAGHKLTELVADILRALGFVCDVSPPGPDGGVDIIAGRGPLGLDSPTLIVEVKSEPGQIKSQVVRGLHSAITQHNADQGLLVAWGGVSNAARREFSTQRTQLAIWDSEILLEKLFETYDQLPIATQQAIPLKRAWVLDDEGG